MPGPTVPPWERYAEPEKPFPLLSPEELAKRARIEAAMVTDREAVDRQHVASGAGAAASGTPVDAGASAGAPVNASASAGATVDTAAPIDTAPDAACAASGAAACTAAIAAVAAAAAADATTAATAYVHPTSLPAPLQGGEQRQALDVTRLHYDLHSNKHATAAEALAARARGASAPLKKYHNRIKRELLARFARCTPGGAMLDLACGRGGDLRKWMDLGVGRVVGVDLSPGEVAEARRRYADCLSEPRYGGGGRAAAWPDPGDGPRAAAPPGVTQADFVASDLAGRGDLAPTIKAALQASPRPADLCAYGRGGAGLNQALAPLFAAVACMFALHYFFASEVRRE